MFDEIKKAEPAPLPPGWCDECGGEGRLPCYACEGGEYWILNDEGEEECFSCPDCDGEGATECDGCDGAGQIETNA